MIKKTNKITYLFSFILVVSIFNLHFGTQKTCEQINHYECKSLNKSSNDNNSQLNQCCSSASTNDDHTDESSNLDSLDSCNCFHLIQYDAQLFISLKNFEPYSYPQIISRLNNSVYNQKDLFTSTEKRCDASNEAIPIILKTESFLI